MSRWLNSNHKGDEDQLEEEEQEDKEGEIVSTTATITNQVF
jgi:hypothetical protein